MFWWEFCPFLDLEKIGLGFNHVGNSEWKDAYAIYYFTTRLKGLVISFGAIEYKVYSNDDFHFPKIN